jgi:hypothetical protein
MLDVLQNLLNNMKDLILIGSYCPDEEREKLLNECVDSLLKVKGDFDILISSHTIIPEYITRKVDYVFYDKKNELITDMEYCNQPWFSPTTDTVVFTTMLNESSTYLAVYRLLIGGLGIAKTFKYNKVHYIEYDTKMVNFTDLYENSKLLDEYDSVVMKKEERYGDSINLEWGLGCFMSFKLDTMNNLFLEYDREKLLEILLNSSSKTNEKITNDILLSNNNKMYIKNYDSVLGKGNQFNLSMNTERDSLNHWAIPYYNSKEDSIFVLGWNNKSETPINFSFIINNDRIININDLGYFQWRVFNIGKFDTINSIVIMVENNIKTTIIFDENNRDKFKNTNYIKTIV